MAQIRPCADLRNNYNEISKICHATYETLTKKTLQIEEERIDKLVAKHFDKHYSDFKEFKKDFFSKINQALKDVDKGNYKTLENFCAEMEEKYDFLQ